MWEIVNYSVCVIRFNENGKNNNEKIVKIEKNEFVENKLQNKFPQIWRKTLRLVDFLSVLFCFVIFLLLRFRSIIHQK